MYLWIWRHLPAKSPLAKAAIAAVLILGVAAFLWYVVFPWVEPQLQFDQGTVDESG
jgi:hypothetical protein